MKKIVTLKLSDLDAGQIIDGLTERMKVWKATERYLRTGVSEIDDFIEECSYPEEAHSIAKHYEKIIGLIRKQLENRKL